MGNCCQGVEEIEENQLTLQNAFYDPDGNCYFWDDAQHYGFTNLMTSEHYTIDENEPRYFYNDKNPNICLDIGGEEQSWYVPNNEEETVPDDTVVTESTKQTVEKGIAAEKPVESDPGENDEPTGDGYTGGTEGRDETDKFKKTKKVMAKALSRKPKSKQHCNSRKTERSPKRTRDRGKQFRRVKKTPPKRSRTRRSRHKSPTGKRRRLKKAGGRRRG